MMMLRNEITELFNIKYPIIQGGMVWCSGWKLASAVSKAGGLGLIGAGSMDVETLEIHIAKCRTETRVFGINIPLLYKHAPQMMDVVIKHKVPIVFTSAGNPSTYTSYLRREGIKVVHVVSSVYFAQKAVEAGVDALVAEGFEAGGHNGRNETTTLVLLQHLKQIKLQVPVIAAGGIYDGSSMYAAFALGAKGVQLGSRFAVCQESSAHENFKDSVLKAKEGDTMLTLKPLAPVRMLKNAFFDTVNKAIESGITKEALQEWIGKGRSRIGMFEGNVEEGELEIGQVSGLIWKKESAQDVVEDLWHSFMQTHEQMQSLFTP